MKTLLVYILVFSLCYTNAYCQSIPREVTLDEVINRLSLESSSAKIELLNFQNDLLRYENYKKSFLPAFVLNFNPINFNRSLRLLQQPIDGSYSYVEDNSNNTNFGTTVRQKISITGGELSIGSNINYLNEFSRKQNSFSTNPFFISYSQQLWGGGKLQRLENKIERAKNEVAVKQYCSNIAQIQQQALTLYLSAILSKMDSELAIDIKQSNDTLLHIAEIKLRNGSITEYDYKQMELQSLNLQYMYENAVKHYAESIQKLFTFLGIENNAEITIPDFDLPLTIDARLAIYYVKKNNPISNQQEIQQLEEEKKLFSIKLKNRFNGNISLNYGINQYAETLADAYRHGNTRQSVIIEFQIPIFQWGINKNNIRIAKNNYDASRLRIEKKNFEFENEVKEKINAYDHSVKLWLPASRAYALSKEQYKMLTKKFSFGKVSVYELATAQKERNDAMQRYYSAIKDSYESFFTLRNLALYDFKKNVELEKILFND